MIWPIAVLIVLCLEGHLVAGCGDAETQELFEAWKNTHEKQYDSQAEEDEACQNFAKNLHHVTMHNMKDEEEYEKDVHEYSDMTPEEQIEVLCQTEVPANVSERVFVDFSISERQAPSSKNWVDEGMVSPVQNQGSCGSCWAFSAAHAIDCQANMVWNYPDWKWQMSEQQLVDCSTSYGNNGCNGGWPQSAFRYVNERPEGITEDYNYPYQAKDGTCDVKKQCNHFHITGYEEVGPSGDENAVANAVANKGCLTSAIYVSSEFMHYSSGVFTDKTYKDQGVNHGVLICGYGNQDGQDYWLVKNSWGTSWGENGYIKIRRNYGNHLKISSFCSVPTGIFAS